MSHVMLNGVLTRRELAQLPVDNRGFRNAESIRAVIEVKNATPLRLEQHADRLAATLSAPEIALPFAVSPRQIARDIAALCAQDGLYDCLAYYVITPGEDSELLPSVQNPPPVTTLLYLEDHAPFRKLAGEGVRLFPSPHRRLRGDRFSNFALGPSGRDIANQRLALRNGCDLPVILDESGNFLETPEANLFAVCDGALITPHPQKDGIFPGVWRELVLECAAREGMMAHQEPLTPQVFARSQEFFLTSCALEIAPARELAGRSFSAFPVALKLLLACRERLHQEIL